MADTECIRDKTCPTCKNSYPHTSDYFGRLSSSKSGLNYYCRGCAATKRQTPEHKASQARYAQSDKGKAAAKRQIGSEASKRAKRKYATTEKNKLAQAKYAASSKGKATTARANASPLRKLRNQRYGSTQKRQLALKRYAQTDKARATWVRNVEKRRARLAGVRCTLTAAEWEFIKQKYGYRCAYCNKKLPSRRLTKDHVIPIAAGGHHSMDNIVPACKPCNCKKNAGPPLKPVQPFLPLVL